MRTFFKFPKTAVVFIFVCCALFLLSSAYWRERCVPALIYPFLHLKEYCVRPIQQWLLWRAGVKELEEIAYKALQERNNALKELIRLRGTRDYILDCQEGLEFAKRYNKDATLVVQILLQQFSEQHHYYFIDAGKNRGIKKDMVVLYDNCLIGRVSEVYEHYSKVILVTDKESHVAARCLLTEARGIVSGKNDKQHLVMEFVSHLDTINDGDMVISHGEGLIFPRGFALGKVTSHELDGVNYHVVVEPCIDLSSLSYCMVLMNY